MTDAITVWICDTRTGEVRSSDDWGDGYRFSPWWWSEGNGSCDCNRRHLFGHDDDDSDLCLGCFRYVIVRVEPMPEGMCLADFDAYYPDGSDPIHMAELADTDGRAQLDLMRADR